MKTKEYSRQDRKKAVEKFKLVSLKYIQPLNLLRLIYTGCGIDAVLRELSAADLFFPDCACGL